jgi:hypothetical protein
MWLTFARERFAAKSGWVGRRVIVFACTGGTQRNVIKKNANSDDDWDRGGHHHQCDGDGRMTEPSAHLEEANNNCTASEARNNDNKSCEIKTHSDS